MAKKKKKSGKWTSTKPSACSKCGEITNGFICGMCVDCWDGKTKAPPQADAQDGEK